MLRLEAVTKTYRDGPGTTTALRDVDASIGDGQFVAVMGPSGSGKTTLALVCAGVERPTAGYVWLDEHDLTHSSTGERAALRRREIGVVFQHGELDPVLTAVENVALPLQLDGRSAKAARERALDALRRCDVAGLADRLPDQLSGGQRQRVAVARAVVGDRRLVVADEPTAAVDTATARAIVELLAGLAADRMSVLMMTHDSRLAGFADDVMYLRDGARVRVQRDALTGDDAAGEGVPT